MIIDLIHEILLFTNEMFELLKEVSSLEVEFKINCDFLRLDML